MKSSLWGASSRCSAASPQIWEVSAEGPAGGAHRGWKGSQSPSGTAHEEPEVHRGPELYLHLPLGQ